MHIEGKRYVVNSYPGADWVSNVRVADQATLTQGRRSEGLAGRLPVFRIDPIT
jgi:hypothetical protein